MGILDYISEIFRSSKKEKGGTPEGRQERYQKWQEELAGKKTEQQKLERRIFEVQKLLRSRPNDTALNRKMADLSRKQDKIGREMSKLNNNLYLHRP